VALKWLPTFALFLLTRSRPLEMKLAKALEMVARTDPGMVRSHNEDAVFIDASLGVAILADGMGGYNAGEVASGIATTLLATNFAREIPLYESDAGGFSAFSSAGEYLVREVSQANMAVYNTSQNQPQYAGMATTLVVAWFCDNRMLVGHLGDSRLYRLRGNVFEQLTKDHSLLQEQLDSGMITLEEARYSQNKNLVTRGLGVDPEVETEIHDHELLVGDIVMLCSDGLSDMVGDAEIASLLSQPDVALGMIADSLVHSANENGGRDNISVILVKINGGYPSPSGWWQKLLARLM
jgi:protein phosphatase